jgi:hypothetical protein
MLNEVKHLAIAREILRGVYPRAKRRTQNDIVHHLTCDKATAYKVASCGIVLSETVMDSCYVAKRCYFAE